MKELSHKINLGALQTDYTKAEANLKKAAKLLLQAQANIDRATAAYAKARDQLAQASRAVLS